MLCLRGSALGSSKRWKLTSTASSQLIACGEENVFNYTGQGVGVRDKIFWIPSKRMWALSVKKEKEPIEKYLKDNNLCLKVKASAEGEEYVKLRHQALLDACVAWNELDNSARYRIKLPEATESCPSLQLAKKDESDVSAEEDSEGENEAEEEEEENIERLVNQGCEPTPVE